MRSERHCWATLNYIHHNPIRHGYVKSWQDWPWSSASQFITHHGRDEAEKIWKEYPIHDYGADWDNPNL
jgi:putative transposase